MKFTGWLNIPNLLNLISRIHEPTKHTILAHLILPRAVPRFKSRDLTFCVLKYESYRPQSLNRSLGIAYKSNRDLIRSLCLLPEFCTILEAFLRFRKWAPRLSKNPSILARA